ncbi:MAG: ACT domain-containing protein [Armatimonadetes bacterium]|jgi:predicted amino acid-binding ACT domain protein|nr:ACT domain-containing protein [Armatimonadota bacterium]
MPAFIVSVTAPDRTGIVAGVTAALRDLGGNITHLNQTVVRGYFTIMLSVDLPEGVDAEAITARVAASAPEGELRVGVMPFREGAPPVPSPADRFVLAILGRDRPGIIARVTAYLAEQGINIEDFTATVVAGDLVLIFGVRVPASLEITHVQRSIETVGREFGITATLQHENIFRATSEVRAVRTLA